VTIQEMLSVQARQHPERIALLAPGRAPMTYRQLNDEVKSHAEWLRSSGVEPSDRIALCLPNGPEMAVAFLAAAAVAVCAPLNPDYREQEFDFYLTDLRAKVLLLPHNSVSPARIVAERLGIRVVELEPGNGEPAGVFRLEGDHAQAASSTEHSSQSDPALILHTSGTTARPKMVPLTHANLTASAKNVQRALGLAPSDRCLNVMPLFHIHGLVAALLATLSAGGSIVCSPGFHAPSFFDWMMECRPTWYTAVPTIHQAVIARAPSHPDVISRQRWRFIRSSSAAMPPKLMQEIERTFEAPLIEAYGMTEAAHQMASNPLPPRPRKPGSVGVAAGPELAILDENGRPVATGKEGEIAVCGPTVTSGYLESPGANAAAFSGKWLRTGDQGYLDENGYLFITGRLKEIINRGGEKIAPNQIDEILLDHPAVAQAVAFAMPDSRLGEEVAAAVVLRAGENATERELREFAASRLADFKIPRRVVIVDEIPKGPTGKLQRIGLAERLGLVPTDRPPKRIGTYDPPSTPVAQAIIRIWQSVLKVDRVGLHDNFLDLGGDSLQATMIAARIRERFGVELTVLDLMDAQTVLEQTHILEQRTHRG